MLFPTLAFGIFFLVVFAAAREASWSDVMGVVEAPVLALREVRDAATPPPETYTGALPASVGAVPRRARANGL